MGSKGLASRLRHRISICRPTETKNARGGFETNWIELVKPFAEVIGLDGRESLRDQVLQGTSFYQVTIRWRAGVRPSDQLRSDDGCFGGKDVNIRSAVDPTGRREELLILADTATGPR